MGMAGPATAQGLGDFIRERRTANGMTQQELAELAGVSQPFLSELERGKATVRLDAVNRVLAVFGKQVGVVDAPRPEVNP
jgi:y4mF family transcriptional regulator